MHPLIQTCESSVPSYTQQQPSRKQDTRPSAIDYQKVDTGEKTETRSKWRFERDADRKRTTRGDTLP